MSHDNECGHTDEEHAEMAKDEALMRATELMAGNFTSMFPDLPTEMVQTNIEAGLMEMFLRAPTDDEYRHYAEQMLKGIVRILVPEGGEDESENAELWTKAHIMRDKIQDKLSDLKDEKEFIEDATDELRVMLEQHGVAEPEKPNVDPLDDLPGQYL